MTGSWMVTALISNESKNPRIQSVFELELSLRVHCVLRALIGSVSLQLCTIFLLRRSRIIFVQFLGWFIDISKRERVKFELLQFVQKIEDQFIASTSLSSQHIYRFLLCPYRWLYVYVDGEYNVEVICQFEQKMDLTDKQLIIWRELGSDLSAPPDICQQAKVFYSHYKYQESWPVDKAPLVFRVAYFLSEKAQVLYDNDGHRLKGIALSANTILRDHPRHQEFLYHLKQMIRAVPIPPECDHLELEVGHFSRHLSFSLAFLNKLKSTLKRIRINQKNEPTPQYEQQLQRYLWLLFINSKAEREVGTDIIQSTCLMSCVFVHFLLEKYKEEGVYSIYFEHDTEGCTLSNQEEELLPFLQGYFHIKDNFSYQKNYAFFMKYLQGISRNIEAKRPFSPAHIQKNIYILQKLYSKKLNDHLIDESTFLRANTTISNQPIRITPFGRRPIFAPRNIPALSHKILNYDLLEQENKSELSNRNKEDKNFSILNRLKNHPTPKTNLIRATPMSEAMEMYNWLYEKKNKYPLSNHNQGTIQEMLALCSRCETQNQEISLSSIELVGGMWGEIQQRCSLDPVPAVPLLLVSSQLALHILNAPLNDISTAVTALHLSELQVWQALDSFLNFDKGMPLGLRLHLLSIETTFINSRLWRSEELVEVIAQEYENSQHRLFKRLMHQAAFEIHFLCRRLNQQETVEDISYLIFQEALKSPQKLLFQRSLEHLILCSIYAATKVNELSIKFNQILSVCKEVLGLSATSYEELIDRVKIGEKSDNIIIFYNMIFLPAIKAYLKVLRSAINSQSENISLPKVREMISKESIALAKATQMASPQMATYFAYSESPILRARLKEINSNTVRRDQQYSLQDIETKFGKFGNNCTLKETRKIKH